MTTAETLSDWLARQRRSLQVQVAHLGGIGNPAIRALLERQRERQEQGASFQAEFSTRMGRLRAAEMAMYGFKV